MHVRFDLKSKLLNTTLRPAHLLILLIVTSSAGGLRDTCAQDGPSGVSTFLTGYGAVRYDAVVEDDRRHDFQALFAPVVLARVTDDVLVESEIEFELEGSGTEVFLEHAQIHYLGWERVQLTAGQFHLPFGLWMHPSWVNRMPQPPLLYADTHGFAPREALLPVLFDLGAMARGKVTLNRAWSLTGALWISQGPEIASEEDGEDEHGHTHGKRSEPSDEDHGDLPPDEDHGHLPPDVDYGINFSDNNTNKMIGARLRLMHMNGFLVHASGYFAKYDPEGRLAVSGLNISAKWQPMPFDVRAEAVLIRQEFSVHGGTKAVSRGGYYLQASRRFAALEPITRWSHLPKSTFDGDAVQDERRQLSLGLNYWLKPSIPIKAAYLWNLDHTDGLMVEWAFGF